VTQEIGPLRIAGQLKNVWDCKGGGEGGNLRNEKGQGYVPGPWKGPVGRGKGVGKKDKIGFVDSHFGGGI